MNVKTSQMALVPLRERPRDIPGPLHHVTTRREDGRLRSQRQLSLDDACASALLVPFPASSTGRREVLLFTRHPVCGILLQQPEPGRWSCLTEMRKMGG